MLRQNKGMLKLLSLPFYCGPKKTKDDLASQSFQTYIRVMPGFENYVFRLNRKLVSFMRIVVCSLHQRDLFLVQALPLNNLQSILFDGLLKRQTSTAVLTPIPFEMVHIKHSIFNRRG